MNGRYFIMVAAALSLSATALAQSDDFGSTMDAAMARMHAAMMTGYTGDADRDFATMMIPHHQGAIDMATIELRFGKDERLRRLAQRIIVEQRQEIEAMRRILLDKGALPDRNAPASDGGHHPGDGR